MKDEYIVGKRKAPEWCRRFLQPYQKSDGSTGYHYYGKRKDVELSVGDKLIRHEDGKVTIIRREGER
jgi:hypothetical protein